MDPHCRHSLQWSSYPWMHLNESTTTVQGAYLEYIKQFSSFSFSVFSSQTTTRLLSSWSVSGKSATAQLFLATNAADSSRLSSGLGTKQRTDGVLDSNNNNSNSNLGVFREELLPINFCVLSSRSFYCEKFFSGLVYIIRNYTTIECQYVWTTSASQMGCESAMQLYILKKWKVITKSFALRSEE